VKRGEGELDSGQYDEPGYVFAAQAAAAVYRRALFDSVGLLDEDYFSYMEDTDLHFRGQLAGFRAWYTPAAVAYHIGNATSARDPDYATYVSRYLITRNRLIFTIKNVPTRRLVKHGPRMALYELRIVAGAVRGGWLRWLLRAWRDALRALPRTLRKRREVLRGQTVPLSYLDSIVTSDLPRPGRRPR
jgi:GT2 family glycosyltransferase